MTDGLVLFCTFADGFQTHSLIMAEEKRKWEKYNW